MILKVARLLLVTLYIFSLESILLTHGLVPVLLWTREPTTLVNPLQKTSKSEFIDILSQSLQREQSPILVFLKDNFCTEDVNHHKKELQVLNKSGSLTYLTAVESALSIFSNLSSYNVSTEDEIESIAEGQLAIVPISDLSAVPEIYNVVQESSNNLIVAITGNTCSYSSLQRAKREVEDEDTGFLIDSERVLLYADRPPLMKFENSKEYKLIGKPTNTSSFDIGDSIFLSMQFDGEEIKEEPFTLRLRFEKLIGYYKLHGISYELDSGKAETFLRSKNSIQFPHNASYHCGQNSLFYYKVKHSKKEVSLIFENLQVQIDTRAFGDVYDCVGFTSIPIWSGVFVTGILASIMTWALTMIFEIKTMDRFDDTKGKCISINAQE